MTFLLYTRNELSREILSNEEDYGQLLVSLGEPRDYYTSADFTHNVELTSEISNFMMLHSEAPQHSPPHHHPRYKLRKWQFAKNYIIIIKNF